MALASWVVTPCREAQKSTPRLVALVLCELSCVTVRQLLIVRRHATPRQSKNLAGKEILKKFSRELESKFSNIRFCKDSKWCQHHPFSRCPFFSLFLPIRGSSIFFKAKFDHSRHDWNIALCMKSMNGSEHAHYSCMQRCLLSHPSTHWYANCPTVSQGHANCPSLNPDG